jgi:hypothetical protein
MEASWIPSHSSRLVHRFSHLLLGEHFVVERVIIQLVPAPLRQFDQAFFTGLMKIDVPTVVDDKVLEQGPALRRQIPAFMLDQRTELNHVDNKLVGSRQVCVVIAWHVAESVEKTKASKMIKSL